MTVNNRNLFASIGHVVADFGATVSFAREITHLYNMSESTFRARGTTRDAAIRAALKRI
jgi:hypothetical protein